MNRNSYVSSDSVTEIESTIIIALLLIFVSQCTRLKYGAQLCINKKYVDCTQDTYCIQGVPKFEF